MISRIEAERVVLAPVTDAIIAASGGSRAMLEAVIGARLAGDWAGGHVFAPRRGLLTLESPRHALVIERASNEVIGDLRFEAQDEVGAVVEIGYAIAPSRRNLGFAHEAVGALVAALGMNGRLRMLVAGCRMDNRASIRVLRKAGFVLDGSSRRGQAFWWRQELPGRT